MFCMAFVGRKQTIYGSITEPLKKLPKQNFQGLLFAMQRSSIRCGSFINFIVVAVFIDCGSS